MSKWRVTFSKTGMGKYISHLDLLRCFSRAIQRSGLPVVYSQGFHPHQKMTFSLPLPIGVTSQCETVDIQFEDGVSGAEIKEKLNENLPMDMQALAVEIPKYAAATIVAAEYRMETDADKLITKDTMDAFFGQKEILISKKTKKGEKLVNLLDFVKAWELTGASEQGFCLRVVLAAGGERNLKPELLSDAINDYLSMDTVWDIHRQQIFCQDETGIQVIFS